MNASTPTDKLVISNVSALRTKYGTVGTTAILSAIATLIANDAKRGIMTRVVNIDSAADMSAVGGTIVSTPADQKGCKAAVDAAFGHYSPDYLMILGAPDIVPHQDLDNPVYAPNQDDDRLIPSDLPYACSAPYGRNASDFIGPTRVIGRLPDLNGLADPDNFVKLLVNAGTLPPMSAAAYLNVFGLTADVWKTSTILSLTAAFHGAGSLHDSPPDGPAWTGSQLAPRSHFINCHGSSLDPKFYGQRGSSYPIAHMATQLLSRVTAGTVIAAECCYGAQLYAVPAAGGQAGICSTYLNCGAIGFYGSSTIAYGPAASNDWADLLCQYFFIGILAGLSTGHAALAALQRYISAKPVMDPTSLKTIAQYLLLGDPSVCPVIAPSSKSFGSSPAADERDPVAARDARQLRRQQLEQEGTSLRLTKPFATRITEFAGARLAGQVASSMRDSGDLESYTAICSFDVSLPPSARDNIKSMAKSNSEQRIHLWGRRRKVAENPHIVDIHLVIGLESDGRLVLVNQAYSR